MSSGRWFVKKAARQGVALGTWATGTLAARQLVQRGPRVRALTYHRFADQPRDPFSVTPEAFEEQMRFLAEERLAVSLDQVRRFVLGQEDLPDGACLVTIDDGLVSTRTEALPVLRRWGIPAVAFITAGLVGSDVRYPEAYVTWEDLEACVASGLVTIGSHAYTHRSLGMIRPEEAFEEAARSKALIEEKLGVDVTSFAYPFGTRSDFNPYTERALADAGYTIAFNSMHGPIRSGADPISLPRVKVEGGEGLWMFRLMCRGAMDTWRAVDHTLFRLQRVRTEVIGDMPSERA
jgi:peptidoglycan/xylan/chitin deacetylase (PgdA/CDA1 family)